MSIIPLGGPSAQYISKLIENNQDAFSGSFAKVVENNYNQLISTAVSNLIKNKSSRFSQAFSALINLNYSNYISQAIANLISTYHNYFEGVISPEIDGTGPAVFTDFSDMTYWVPFRHYKWEATTLSGGGVRFETNVSTVESIIYSTLVGYRFRPLVFPDVDTGRIVLRTVMTDINLGTGTSGSNTKNGVGLAWVGQNKIFVVGAGRADKTSVSPVGASGINLGTGGMGITTTTANMPGTTWEARITYDQLTVSPYSCAIQEEVRVDGGSWVQMTGGNQNRNFDMWVMLYGVHTAVVGLTCEAIHPLFAGTVTSFNIDEGRYISF